MRSRLTTIPLLILWLTAGVACKSLSDHSGHYSGAIVPHEALRVGFAADVTMTLVVTFLDERQLEGTLSTSDGTFAQAALTPIQKLNNDRLSTFTFDDGGVANYLYSALVTAGPHASQEALIVITVFDETLEARVILGSNALFGVFKLHR